MHHQGVRNPGRAKDATARAQTPPPIRGEALDPDCLPIGSLRDIGWNNAFRASTLYSTLISTISVSRLTVPQQEDREQVEKIN